MNNISKTHQHFSELLNNPRVLEFPEEFLGPNYKEVLNFWLILDDLSEEQGKNIIIFISYCDFWNNSASECYKVVDLAIKASNETIGWNNASHAGAASDVVYVAWDVYEARIIYWITLELIGMHKIIEQQKPLTFFEMFLDSYEHHL